VQKWIAIAIIVTIPCTLLQGCVLLSQNCQKHASTARDWAILSEEGCFGKVWFMKLMNTAVYRQVERRGKMWV